MEQYLFRLPADIKRRFKSIAASKGLNMAQLLNILIEDYLRKEAA